MLPAIIIGGGLSYLFSRVLSGTEAPTPRYAYPPRPMPGPPPLQPDAHMEPRTRAGLDRLLMGGTPDQLDQAANSLLRSGYPLAAQLCVLKAGAMQRFDAERKAGAAHQERARIAAAEAQMQAQARHAEIAAHNAQADAIAQAATNMHALAAQMPAGGIPPQAPPTAGSGNVHASPEVATVSVVSPPGSVSVAPPNGAASGEAPLHPSRGTRDAAPKAGRKTRAKARPAASPEVQQHVNGRARAGH